MSLVVGRAAGASWLLLAGCESRPAMSELSARVEATVEEHAIEFSVEVRVGDEPYLIDPEEHVLVGFREEVVDLWFLEREYRMPYVGRLGISDLVGADEEISLTLDRGSSGRLTIAGTAPPPITISVPSPVRDSAGVVVSWSPIASDPMRWLAFSSESYGPIREDTGMLTFPAGVLAPASLEYESDVMLTLVRERITKVDSELTSASFRVTQTRSTTFTVTP